MDPRLETIYKAAAYIKEILDNEGLAPKVGIVLGSGLGRLSDDIENPVTIPYKNIPGFPVSTAIGHKGNFIVGTLAGKTVIAMQGRLHYYEGYDMDMVVQGDESLGDRVFVRLQRRWRGQYVLPDRRPYDNHGSYQPDPESSYRS